MAKIIEEIVVLKFSKIVKDTDGEITDLVTKEIQSTIEQVTQEIVGDAVIVEVQKV